MTARILLSFSLIFSILLTAVAQQPPPPPKPPLQQKPPAIDSQDVVRITTNLVQIDAVVTKDGNVISDLQPEDFDILEDGKPRAITHFSYISNIPGTPPVTPAAPRSADKTAPPIPPAKINLNDQRRVVALVVDDLGISRESMPQTREPRRSSMNMCTAGWQGTRVVNANSIVHGSNVRGTAPPGARTVKK